MEVVNAYIFFNQRRDGLQLRETCIADLFTGKRLRPGDLIVLTGDRFWPTLKGFSFIKSILATVANMKYFDMTLKAKSFFHESIMVNSSCELAAALFDYSCELQERDDSKFDIIFVFVDNRLSLDVLQNFEVLRKLRVIIFTNKNIQHDVFTLNVVEREPGIVSITSPSGHMCMF